jgi:GNAT superfamily N-acetyltransferase
MALTVREIPPGDEASVAGALLELRPRHGTPEAVAAAAAAQRPDGYRLLGAFDEEGALEAVAVAGFRVQTMLVEGRVLYVDDLSTLPSARGRGAATALLQELDRIGRAEACTALHLDSGVVPERQAAHRRYFGHGMRIASFHFSKPLG